MKQERIIYDVTEAVYALALLVIGLEFLRPGVIGGYVNLLMVFATLLLTMAYLLTRRDHRDDRLSALVVVGLGAILLVVPNSPLLLRLFLALSVVGGLLLWKNHH